MCIFKQPESAHKTLFKYYGCTGENKSRIESRLQGEIFFSSPLKFNDPYDCQLPEIVNNTEFVNKRRVLEILDEEGFDGDSTYQKLCSSEDKPIVRKIYEKQAELLGILCLTDSYNNTLMWSHYAENNGICIEYDMEVLREELYSLLKPKIERLGRNFSDKRIFMDEVIYDKSLNMSIPLFFSDYTEAIKGCKLKYWHKHVVWKYEKEYRIGVSLGGNVAVTIPNMVKRVFLGCNTSFGQMAHIWSICKRLEMTIPVYIMRKTPIGLVAEELSTETLDKVLMQYQDKNTPFWHHAETNIQITNNEII